MTDVEKPKKFKILQSYLVVEAHEVIADSEEAAFQIMKDGKTNTFVKSYDDDYCRDSNGEIAREVIDVTEVANQPEG